MRCGERGWTALGALFAAGLLGFAALIAMRIAPLYLDDFTVVAELEAIRQELTSGMLGPVEIRERFGRRLDINSLRSVRPGDLKIIRDGRRIVIELDYEARTRLIGNLDVIARFHHRLETS